MQRTLALVLRQIVVAGDFIQLEPLVTYTESSIYKHLCVCAFDHRETLKGS